MDHPTSLYNHRTTIRLNLKEAMKVKLVKGYKWSVGQQTYIDEDPKKNLVGVRMVNQSVEDFKKLYGHIKVRVKLAKSTNQNEPKIYQD